MNKEEFLSWLGNAINFIVVLYIARTTFQTNYFDVKSLILSATALLISAMINLYIILHK